MYCPNPECPDTQADGRPGEYVAGIEMCPVCGAPLVERLEQALPGRDARPDQGPEVEMVPVFETADPAEAQIVKTILTGAEIHFVNRGQERFSALAGGHASFRFNPGVGSLVFVVSADRAEEARALLTEVGGEESG